MAISNKKRKALRKKVLNSPFNVPDLSNTEVLKAFDNVALHEFPLGRLINPGNRYSTDTIERIESDFLKVPRKKNRSDLLDYIGISTITHISDAWEYFAKAIEASNEGNSGIAMHLAYYAELRAIMAIMATQGVGIFSEKHFWTETSGKLSFAVNLGGTHHVVEYFTKEWSNYPGNRSKIFDILSVANNKISDWIRLSGSSTRAQFVQTQLSQWLQEWSIDLELKKDQFQRNERSYRPNNVISTSNSKEKFDFLKKLWQACAPDHYGTFSEIDRHILRHVLKKCIKISRGKTLNGDDESKAIIENIYIDDGGTIDNHMVSFLSYELEPNEYWLFENARNRNYFDGTDWNELPIICRSLLLIRLATLFSSDFLNSTSVGNDRKLKLNFWWKSLAVQHGILKPTDDLEEAADLFSEIHDRIINIESDSGFTWSCSKDVKETFADDYQFITQFERPMFWGLGL